MSPASPVLAGRFFTTEPPRMPIRQKYKSSDRFRRMYVDSEQLKERPWQLLSHHTILYNMYYYKYYRYYYLSSTLNFLHWGGDSASHIFSLSAGSMLDPANGGCCRWRNWKDLFIPFCLQVFLLDTAVLLIKCQLFTVACKALCDLAPVHLNNLMWFCSSQYSLVTLVAFQSPSMHRSFLAYPLIF